MKTATIEFFIDELSDSLIAVEHDVIKSDQATEEVLRLPLGNIRSRESSEIQRNLGYLILTFLNSRSPKDLKLPRDLVYEKELDDRHINQLHLAFEASNPQAIYDLAVGLIGHGISEENWSEIEQGEIYLNQAIEMKNSAAINYKSETWDLIRPRLIEKFRSANK